MGVETKTGWKDYAASVEGLLAGYERVSERDASVSFERRHVFRRAREDRGRSAAQGTCGFRRACRLTKAFATESADGEILD
jgi:hypothetical protein